MPVERQVGGGTSDTRLTMQLRRWMRRPRALPAVNTRTHRDGQLHLLPKQPEDCHQPVDGEAAELRLPDAGKLAVRDAGAGLGLAR